MTHEQIYLDPMGHLWSPDRDALHEFAQRIGMRRLWFQDRPALYHYDVRAGRIRRAAVRAGAVRISSRELVVLMRGSWAIVDPRPPGGAT